MKFMTWLSTGTPSPTRNPYYERLFFAAGVVTGVVATCTIAYFF